MDKNNILEHVMKGTCHLIELDIFYRISIL